LNHPYSTELADFFKKPLLEAGNPGLNAICEYSGVTKEQLLPGLQRNDCRQYLIMGTCMFGDKCKFDHRTAKKAEADEVMTKLKRFKEDPLGCSKGGEKKNTNKH